MSPGASFHGPDALPGYPPPSTFAKEAGPLGHGLTRAAAPLEFHCLPLKASGLRARKILPVMAELDTLSCTSFQRLPKMLPKYECGQEPKSRPEKATREKWLQHRSGALTRQNQFSAAADERLISPVSLSTSSLNPAHVQHYSHCVPPAR